MESKNIWKKAKKYIFEGKQWKIFEGKQKIFEWILKESKKKTQESKKIFEGKQKKNCRKAKTFEGK